MTDMQPPSFEGGHSNKELYVSLRDYFESRIREVERAAASAAHNSEVALTKASTATEYRLEGLNEFRNAMADQSSKFATKAEMDATRDAIQGEIKSLQRTVYTLVGALAAIQAIVTVLADKWPF